MIEPLWSPSEARVAAARMTEFASRVSEEWGVGIRCYHDLWKWSVTYPDQFWATLWDFAGVIASEHGERPVEDLDSFPGARWFPGARLNFAENLLRWRGDGEALVFKGEGASRRSMTFQQLRAAVGGLQRALRAEGVGVGDRVAGFLPNVPEAVVAMLASASLGATWTSCSPDFGFRSVLDRFGQVDPKVLFVADGYRYNGRSHGCLDRARELAEALPSVLRLVVIPFADEPGDVDSVPRAVSWEAYSSPGDPEALVFEQLPFDHPLYILYSSGTTGLPKCIVHGAGGTLLQHLKEHLLHCDLRRGDSMLYFTTCGWMMWNWLVSALAAGVTVLLYDGSPFFPDGEVVWSYVAEERARVFGTGAKYLSACQKADLHPGETHDLAALDVLLSTGSPLSRDGFRWVYENVKSDLQLSSISGGTDIVSCFALGNPTGSVFPGELQCRGLGMDVDVHDSQGNPLRGKAGELVCKTAFPSAPVGFWDDPDGARYQAAYFQRSPGIWTHGDWAEITLREGLVVHGRSDAVLNPGGVRIGTAEIYRLVESLDEVVEAIVVGQDWEGDVRVVLFVRLRQDLRLDDDLRDRIRSAVRAGASPRHVPAKVIQVPDIPRTLSGKIVELAVRNVIHGRPVENRDALANPQSLDHFVDLEELSA